MKDARQHATDAIAPEASRFHDPYRTVGAGRGESSSDHTPYPNEGSFDDDRHRQRRARHADVTIDGRLKSAANIEPAWIDFPVVERMGRLLKRPVSIINEADAAGIAEMRFGAGRDQPGVVIFLTLGTGVGSGTFVDGILVPNTEFGQMEIRGRARRKAFCGRRSDALRLSWKAWTADLDEHLDRIHQLMWPNLMILGGGGSKNADRFIPKLTVRCPVVAAQLRNDAGIIGEAIIAAEAPAPPPGTPVPND